MQASRAGAEPAICVNTSTPAMDLALGAGGCAICVPAQGINDPSPRATPLRHAVELAYHAISVVRVERFVVRRQRTCIADADIPIGIFFGIFIELRRSHARDGVAGSLAESRRGKVPPGLPRRCFGSVGRGLSQFLYPIRLGPHQKRPQWIADECVAETVFPVLRSGSHRDHGGQRHVLRIAFHGQQQAFSALGEDTDGSRMAIR